VPRHVRQPWIKINRIAWARYSAANSQEEKLRALVIILLLPSHALRRNGGKNKKKKQSRDLNRAGWVLTHVQDQDDAAMFRGPVPDDRGFADNLPRDEETQRILRARRLLEDGFVSRAASALSQSGVLDLQQREGALETLRALHPVGPAPDTIPLAPDSAPLFPIDADQSFKKHIRNLANGAAPGPSGWTGEMILPLVDDPMCLQGIAALCTDMSTGNLDDRCRSYLVSSWLLGIPKPADPNAARPLAIGEVFYRLVATILVKEVKSEAADLLITESVLQLGVGVKGG
jgi:hypothetical protein